MMDTTMKALSASLNLRQMRNEIISSNIANAETPGYKAKRLDFEEALQRAINIDRTQTLEMSSDRHYNVGGGGFNNLAPSFYEDPNGVVSENGNTVNRDEEMVKMAENKIMYDASIQLMKKKISTLKYLVDSEN
ncbi:MAG: flagellar basal body rod protein FlgB [Bacteriovoracales bacterium]|nr:flagellar basal body rod protein FlgB [Bacteriovoracales bacterium]